MPLDNGEGGYEEHPLSVNKYLLLCQEQIELSAFLFTEGIPLRTGAERRTSASLTIAEELSIADLPRLLRSEAGDGCG